MKKRAGVTIFEILAAIAIFGLVLAISMAGYRTWQDRVQLSNARQELVAALAEAQQYAVASAQETNWGIHLEDDYYVLFKGSFYNDSDPENRVSYLHGVSIEDPDQTFDDGAGGRIANVVFTKYSGQTYNTGTIHIISASDPVIGQNIRVESLGVIQ